MTAPDFTVTLSPAQWEHLAEHGWTLVEAPTGPCPREHFDLRRSLGHLFHFDQTKCPGVVPVPATAPCPECNGSGQARIGDLMAHLPPCRHCDGSGVVPRTVGIIRPERECPECEAWCEALVSNALGHPRVDLPPDCTEPACDDGVIPAERVGTATVTPVPVVDVGDAPPDVPHVVVSGVTGTVWWCGGKRVESGRGSTVWTDVQQVQVLFATPPNPGTTVWRLDKENDRD